MTSPVKENALAVSKAVAVSAFPVKSPVTLPSILATSVPVVTVKSPVEAPVNVPVPIRNLSVLSSNPIKALSESPLSITIPKSPVGEPVCPFASSINLSAITVFVDADVVVVPLTVKLPDNVTFPVNVCPPSAALDNSVAPTELAASSLESTAPEAICLANTWSVAIFAEVILLSAIFAVVTFDATIFAVVTESVAR